MSFEEALATVAAAHVLQQRRRQAECGCHGYQVVTWRAGEPEPDVADTCPRCGHPVRRISVLVEGVDTSTLSEADLVELLEQDLALLDEADAEEEAGRVKIAAAEAFEIAASARLLVSEALAELVDRADETPLALEDLMVFREAVRPDAPDAPEEA